MTRKILLLLLLIPALLFAQNKRGKELADSLLKVLPDMHEDTNKVKVLVKLSNAVYITDPEKGIAYGADALALANRTDWIKGQAMANMAMGVNQEQRSALTNALGSYFAALKLYEQINDKKGIAYACWGAGNIYNVQKSFARSLEYEFKALAIYKEMGDNRGGSSVMGNIANNYLMAGDLDKALEYFKKSLAVKEEIGEPVALSTELTNIGTVYFKKADYLSAIHYYTRAISLITADNATVLYAKATANLGACYLKIAIDSVHTTNDSLIPSDRPSIINKGVLYIEQALKLSKKTGDLEQLYNSYNDLAEAKAYKGDYKGAYNDLEKKIQYGDSLFSDENRVKIGQLEAQRAIDLKEKDMQIIKLRSQVYIVSIILLVFIISVGVVRLNRQRKNNDKLSQEKEKHLKRIDSQNKILEHIAHVQSHDLRNSVSNVLALSRLFNKEDPADPNNAEIIAGILEVAAKMDKDIIEVVNKENKLRKDGV